MLQDIHIKLQSACTGPWRAGVSLRHFDIEIIVHIYSMHARVRSKIIRSAEIIRTSTR